MNLSNPSTFSTNTNYRPKAIACLQAPFSPQLMQAATILRMGGNHLVEFLRFQPNPCLRIGRLPPPPQSEINIRQLLHHQRQEYFISSELAPIVDTLIEFINDEGFLDLPHAYFNIEDDLLNRAIQTLREFSPPGVGYPNSQEYLASQLRSLSNSTIRDTALQLVESYFPWLQRKRWDKLPRKNLFSALALLEKMSPYPVVPHPSAALSIPDVLFVKKRGFWQAEAGESMNLSVSIDSKVKASSYEKSVAQLIVSAIRARKQWILKLARYVANYQSTFLSSGNPVDIQMLKLQTIAQKMEISSIFISHIVHDKIAIFYNGHFPLKYLFQQSSQKLQVQEMIKSIISHENPLHPLSDEILRKKLQQQGLTVARRTVCKQRQQAGILAASKRKHYPPPTYQQG